MNYSKTGPSVSTIDGEFEVDGSSSPLDNRLKDRATAEQNTRSDFASRERGKKR